MELQQLRYFVAVARLGNFTRAAEFCHATQPTLSQQIGKLEQELGCSLLTRSGRATTLTDAGRTLLDHAEHALSLLEDAHVALKREAKQQRFRIAAIPTIAPYFLPRAMVALTSALPETQFEIRELTTDESLHSLTHGELDLAILALPVRGEHLDHATLFTEELELVLPADHRLASKTGIRFADLTTERFLLLHEAHCLTGQVVSFCARHALSPIVTARLHQLSTAIELVALGQGISFLPQMAIPRETRPSLVFRPIRGERPNRTVGVVWSKLRFRHKVFDDVLNCLKSLESSQNQNS